MAFYNEMNEILNVVNEKEISKLFYTLSLPRDRKTLGGILLQRHFNNLKQA